MVNPKNKPPSRGSLLGQIFYQLEVDATPKIVLQNPYRILGIYANSPKRDIVANKGKATAFLKVNRSLEFPFDLKGLLPPINRTLEMIDNAESSITIAKEQIKYAQFWFLKISPQDEVAFNHLFAGNLAYAKEIWSKFESLSSIQNRIVCFLIENKPWLAVKDAEKLYDCFGNTYINNIDDSCTLQMTGSELFHQFIDTLGADIGMQNLLSYDFREDTKEYISSKTTETLINNILSEVERTKKISHSNAKARIEAAKKLIKNTKDDILALKDILKESDPQYQILADKLGLEILQCGIDYFNSSDDDDRHQTAMKIQKYAQSIVVGSLAKQRCEENVKILQRLINELPPNDALIYDQYIEKSLSSFINKITDRLYIAPKRMGWLKEHLKKCGPYISSIKEICGANHPYYIRKSTQIVDYILTHIIDIVNGQLDHIKKYSGYGMSAPRSSIDDLREIIIVAWQLILMMDKFDMDPSFKQNRYLPNRNTLKNILNQARVNVGKSESIDMRSEKQMLSDIKTLSDCEQFLTIFPDSKQKYIVEEKRQIIRFNSCNSLKDCDDLLKSYPSKKAEIEKLRDKIIFDILEKCESIEDYEGFLISYSDCKYVNEAKERLEELIRNRRRKRIISTIIWSLVSLGILGVIGYLVWDSIQKEQLEKQAAKKAEYDLYNSIVNKGDSSSCARFLESYPNSKFVGEVKSIKEEYEFRHLSTIDDCIEFKTNYYHSQYASLVDSIIDKKVEEMRQELINDNINFDSATVFISKFGNVSNASIQSLVHEVKEKCSQILKEEQEREDKFRQDSIKKEEEARKREEYEKYGTDANAWKTAKAEDTMDGYKEYLKRYPKGKHVQEANKEIIDLEVASVMLSGDYGHLPSAQRVSYGSGKNSTINLTNSSGRTITILYSGVKSMKIVLEAYQTRTIILPSSSYDVVATAPGVRSFYGKENLTGGVYESEYYISTSRY